LIKIFTQLILGINEFHKNKILHGDLKLSNIFVDNNDNVKIGLKIIIIYYLFIHYLFTGDFECTHLDVAHTHDASTIKDTLFVSLILCAIKTRWKWK
jgi:serine/threonine protein kinase